MYFKSHGDPQNPALVCVPGLMGGPEDFQAFIPEWISKYFVLVLDPNHERRELGIGKLTAESLKEVSYDSTAAEILQILKDNGKDSTFLVGFSVGGKVVYDFAIKYPALFRGGVITDMGPGPFEDSDLYKLVDRTVLETNFDLAWPEMKEDLKKRIPDRSLRSLIQTQLHYPSGKPPAEWKVAMRNFRQMLQHQDLDDQFEGLSTIDDSLLSKQSFFHVLRATHCSGISELSMPRVQVLKAIRLYPVSDGSHFLHVTHKQLIRELVAKL